MEHVPPHRPTQPTESRRRRMILTAAALIGVLVGVLGLVGVLTDGGSGRALAAGAVPFTDSSASGALALCDQSGQPLTHGNVTDKPFVWKAIGDTAAKAPYNGTGASATLYAYQPRQGVDPRQWGGAQLSAAAKFTNPAHPTAAMTGLDGSLSLFLAQYAAQWEGLVQLRMYLGAPNEPIYNLTYDAAVIKVTGQTWSAVSVGSVSCGAGSAVSLEHVLATNSAAAASLVAQTTENPNATPSSSSHASGSAAGATQPGGPSASGAAAANASTAASAPAGGSAPPANAAASAGALVPSGSSGSLGTPFWIMIGIGVLGGGFLGVQWLRSRS